MAKFYKSRFTAAQQDALLDIVETLDVGDSSGSKYTGHADAEGLKAIGWTDEDIAYYQANGVNWNEEEDQYHKVTDDNKALYGVLTADNIRNYWDRIVYLPKIDTSGKTSMTSMFNGCFSLVAIPQLDTSRVEYMNMMFYRCFSLVSIPQLNTAKVTDMSDMFNGCFSLVAIPQLDTANVKNMSSMFCSCHSLVTIPQLDTANVTDMGNMFYNCYSFVSIPQLNTVNVTEMSTMFYGCNSLIAIPQLDTAKVTGMGSMSYGCFSLVSVNLKNVKIACNLNSSNMLSKESLLYLIDNEAATSAIKITLASYAKTRLANDPDVLAALANHPNITLA